MTQIRSVVLGCGAYLPEQVVTNAQLAARIDTSDEWIVQRTGIRERHVAAEGESQVLRSAGLKRIGQRYPQRILNKFDWQCAM